MKKGEKYNIRNFTISRKEIIEGVAKILRVNFQITDDKYNCEVKFEDNSIVNRVVNVSDKVL